MSERFGKRRLADLARAETYLIKHAASVIGDGRASHIKQIKRDVAAVKREPQLARDMQSLQNNNFFRRYMRAKKLSSKRSRTKESSNV